MNLKGIVFLVVLLFSSVIFSCYEEECPQVLPYFEIVELVSSALNKQNQQSISTSNPTRWSDVSYQISLQFKGVAEHHLSPNGTLFALDCASPGYLGSRIGIKELAIFSNSNYSSLIQTGDLANRIFGVEVLGELLSIQEFNLIFRESFNFDKFSLVLVSPPDIIGELQIFTIHLKMMDGTEFETSTKEIRIL
jgi:hypothetical protein